VVADLHPAFSSGMSNAGIRTALFPHLADVGLNAARRWLFEHFDLAVAERRAFKDGITGFTVYCPTCGGSGVLRWLRPGLGKEKKHFPTSYYWRTCRRCGGAGKKTYRRGVFTAATMQHEGDF
jgi:hypothetical protein